MIKYRQRAVGFNIPWFIFDIYNKQLITSPTIPGDITDAKSIVLSETPIPGLNFDPINTGGMGNKKLSFTLPLVKRNNSVGNLLVKQQLENLRNQSFGLSPAAIFNQQLQFYSNPKVLYFWGAGSAVPLEYYVAKCDFVHRSAFVNRFGYTQYSEVSIELWLDETSPLYRAEEIFRKLSSIAGTVDSAYNIVSDNRKETQV